ncbi:MAG: glycosyltransferase family 39 protein [Planctomycetaceae bacterium]
MASVLSQAGESTITTPGTGRPVRAWHVGLGVAFLIGAFSLFFELADAKSLGSHEGYAIVPAREMLLSGDYVVPRFGEMPRLKKPPLIYWSILGSASLTGQLDIWSARLPAAVSGLLLGGLMACWAWRWYGGVAAVGAAVAQLTSVYVLVFARKAEADMILVLLIAAALSLVSGHDPTESRRATFLRWVGIWACAAVSWLGKFHFAPAMIFAPAIAWLVLERRWRFLFGMLNPAGLLLFAVAAGVWPALVLQRLPEAWAIWQEETIGRAVGELGHQPVWFYLPHLVTWTLPWTLFAVMAWPESLRVGFGTLVAELLGKRTTSGAANSSTSMFQRLDAIWRKVVAVGDPRERFLWVWLGVSFAIVTISANKHPHYILPALPAFSLWTGRRFAQLAAQARQGRRLLPLPLAVGLTVAATAAVAGSIVLADQLPEGLTLEVLLSVVGAGGVGLTIGGWLLYARRNRTAAAVIAVAWVVACGAAIGWMTPAQDHRRGAYHFAEKARSRFGQDAEIGVYGIEKDAAVWYLGEPTFRAETPQALAARLEASSRLRILTIADHEDVLSQLGDVRVIERFRDQPGLPKVVLGHYRKLVLLELEARSATAEDPGREPRPSGSQRSR